MHMHSSNDHKSQRMRLACLGNYEPSAAFLIRLGEALRSDPHHPRDLSPAELRIVAKDLVAAFYVVLFD